MNRLEDDFAVLEDLVHFATRAAGREQVAEAVIACADAVRGLAPHDAPAVAAADRLVREAEIGSSDTLETMLGALWAALRMNSRVSPDSRERLLAIRRPARGEPGPPG
jgi:hypothetical protein